MQTCELCHHTTRFESAGLRHKAAQTAPLMQMETQPGKPSSPLTQLRFSAQKATKDASSTGHPASPLCNMKCCPTETGNSLLPPADSKWNK